MHVLRRLLLGASSGLTVAGLLAVWVQLASAGPGAVTVTELGGIVGLLMTGVLLGLGFAGLFQPVPGGQVENLMGGMALGVIAWVVLALNVYPALMGHNLMWGASTAGLLFPALIAYILLGALTGLGYGVAHVLLAERLALVEPPADVVAPPLAMRIVILGGGYAGIAAAQKLELELVNDPSVGIWLVNETNYMLHTPMLSEVTASSVSSQHIVPPLRSFFRRVQAVEGAVERIDLEQRIVHLALDARSPRRQLAFDHLVLTVGSVPNFFGNRDVEQHAFTFKSLEDAVMLRNQVISLFERADFEKDTETRRRMLTFVVAGGGFAGVELVGAINDFARGILAYYPNVLPEEIRPVLVHSRDRILPELSEPLANYAQEKLEQRGIEFKLGVRVTGAKPGAVLIGDETVPTETFVWTAGSRPHPVLETLGLPLTKRGQIETNTEFQVVDVPGLWAAGDCAQVPDLSSGNFVPPTAQHAVRAGKVLGHNVAASIRGKPPRTFRFRTLGSLAALGHQLAVAEIFGYRFSGFLAWLMWRTLYLSKLPTLEKQVRVGLDWGLDIFFPPDIVQTIGFAGRPHSPAPEATPEANRIPHGAGGKSRPGLQARDEQTRAE